jgi:hypothetical protein
MLRRMALVITDVSEDLTASIFSVTRIDVHLLSPDEGGAKFFRNVGSYKRHTT